MKSKLFLFTLISQLFLTGCSKEELLQEERMVALRVEMNPLRTRSGEAEPTPTRYIMEIFNQDDQTSHLIHKVSESGQMDVALPVGAYDFYFWADRGESYYDATDLKAVALTYPYEASLNRVCYSGSKKSVTVNESFTLNATLNRPVARINYTKTGAKPSSDTVKLTYKQLPTVYNVLQGAIDPTGIETAVNASGTFSPLASPTVPFVSDFIFPTSTERIDIDLSLDGGIDKALNNIQIQKNKQTNIYFQ